MTDYNRRESDRHSETIAAALRSEALRLWETPPQSPQAVQVMLSVAANLRKLADAFDPPAPSHDAP